jgi:tetratricopeptide (TPR) repeat protein
MEPSTLLVLRRSRFRPVWAVVGAVVVVALVVGGVYAYRASARSYHLRAAAEARERQDYAQERAHLMACLKLGGASQEVYLQAARAARHLHDYDEAQRLLRECELLRRQEPDPAINLERLLLGIQSGNVSPINNPNIAECVRQVPEGDPSVAELLQMVADKYIRDYMLGSAGDTLGLWIERDPTNVKPLLLRGWIIEQLNVNYLPAVPDFQKAVELEPDNHLARIRLAEAYQTARQPEKALPHLEYVQKQRPDDILLVYYLGFSLLDLGEAQEAKEVLDRLLLPERLALIERLSACLHAGHPVPPDIDATPWYKDLMTEVPYGAQGEPDYIIGIFVRGLVQRARIARATGGDAEPFLRQAVKIDPYDYDPVYQLVIFLEGHGKAEEAKPLRERMAAIRADLDLMRETADRILAHPTDPEPRCDAAVIQLRFHEPPQARLWLASALRQSPGYPRAVRLLEEIDRLKFRPAPGCSGGEATTAPAAAAGKP